MEKEKVLAFITAKKFVDYMSVRPAWSEPLILDEYETARLMLSLIDRFSQMYRAYLALETFPTDIEFNGRTYKNSFHGKFLHQAVEDTAIKERYREQIADAMYLFGDRYRIPLEFPQNA